MSKENILLWHIGLGDALICNGLVRELHSRLGHLTVPVLPKYRKSIEWMFGDLPGVKVLPLVGFDETMDDLRMKRRHINEVVNLAHYNEVTIGLLNKVNRLWQGQRTFDQGFYDQAGVPFEFKWSKFFHRKHPDQIVPPRDPYAFMHLDPTRKYVFEPRFQRAELPVVTNLDWRVENFFQWQDVLEQASEIHVMESSFSNWIELMPQFRDRPMFVYDAKHMFRGAGFPALNRRPWQIVTTWCPTRGLRFHVRGAGNAASLVVPRRTQDVMTITIERSATDVLWDIQLRKPELPLEAGTPYELSFRARAREPREIAYGVNDHRFNDLGLFERIRLGPAWEDFRRTFVPRASDHAADLHFDLGTALGSLDMAHVALRCVADGQQIHAENFTGCACWPSIEPDEEDD